ncbi:MAG: tRNA (N(6)-L-threonylcarbamoyladenosine(37)-C(2))-methylthiotransferase MtaB [Dehalococcoidia bacterium]|nr:tRNA (N(6)-L-threonylcarbamoyladenosine(37)-C(2))-methylthiotransferase MtaB [Dehalococcoidia bacterium]
MTLTAAVHTLGCKLNQAESEELAAELSSRGVTITSGNTADLIVINTCSVTHAADAKSRHLVRMMRALNPESVIAVTGCYAERARKDLLNCGADMISGNREKAALAELLTAGPLQQAHCTPAQGYGRVRSFVKIQDGCDKFCSYCIVPFVRPTVYSIDADSVVDVIRSRAADGYKEIVLTGTEIGSYFSKGLKLAGLIRLVLHETSAERLHLSSLQPQEITPELLALWQDRRLCRHFHIALQSGSDKVLKRMGRHYTTDIFRRAIETVRASVPDASVTTDIIVGFPGESDEDFTYSLEFCRSMKFAALHIFPYSCRPGTMAAKMADKVKESIKKQRSSIMLELAPVSAHEFAARFIHQTREVLWEKEVRPGSQIYSGLTDNYIRVYTRSSCDITNKITRAHLIGHIGDSGPSFISKSKKRKQAGLWGEISA